MFLFAATSNTHTDTYTHTRTHTDTRIHTHTHDAARYDTERQVRGRTVLRRGGTAEARVRRPKRPRGAERLRVHVCSVRPVSQGEAVGTIFFPMKKAPCAKTAVLYDTHIIVDVKNRDPSPRKLPTSALRHTHARARFCLPQQCHRLVEFRCILTPLLLQCDPSSLPM